METPEIDATGAPISQHKEEIKEEANESSKEMSTQKEISQEEGTSQQADDGSHKGGLGQITKYFGVSFTQTFVEFGVFAFLEAIGLPYRIANTLAIVCSGSYNFVMNRNITFKSSSNFTRSVILFILLYLWNLIFSNIMMGFLPDLLGIPTTVVKVICMCCQGVWGYLLCKYVIFR